MSENTPYFLMMENLAHGVDWKNLGWKVLFNRVNLFMHTWVLNNF